MRRTHLCSRGLIQPWLLSTFVSQVHTSVHMAVHNRYLSLGRCLQLLQLRLCSLQLLLPHLQAPLYLTQTLLQGCEWEGASNVLANKRYPGKCANASSVLGKHGEARECGTLRGAHTRLHLYGSWSKRRSKQYPECTRDACGAAGCNKESALNNSGCARHSRSQSRNEGLQQTANRDMRRDC